MAIFGPLRSTLCRRKPSTLEATPAPILQLPLDVLRYLVDRIPAADAAALALSSKAILSAIGHEILRIEGTEDRVKLLRHLEIFFPGHLLCYQCGKFHRRQNKFHVYEEDTECDRKNGRFWGKAFVLDLPFTKAQEIMNRHRYGRKHGISEKNLDRCLYRYFVSPFDRRSEKTRAKIVDDQLLIETEILFFNEHEQRPVLCQGCRFCPHLASWDFQFDETSYDNTTFIRCVECPTEIRLDVIFWSPFYIATFRTTVWCNLGPCRSPFEIEWRALTDSSSTDTDHTSNIYISRKEARYIRFF